MPAISVYSGTLLQSLASLRQWQSVGTTVSGVATFIPTTNGIASGTSLFQVIQSAIVTGKANTGSAIAMPMASIKAITADLRTITANVVIGLNILSLGNTVAFAPDGTEVMLLVWGVPYA